MTFRSFYTFFTYGHKSASTFSTFRFFTCTSEKVQKFLYNLLMHYVRRFPLRYIVSHSMDGNFPQFLTKDPFFTGSQTLA